MKSKRFYVEVDGKQIPVTEKVYRAYKRPLWVEHKRSERSRRCIDSRGFRCMEPCSKCLRQRDGSVLSLDRLLDTGFDIQDDTDVEEIVLARLLSKELAKALGELDSLDRRIIKLVMKGETERQIAGRVGLSQKGVNKRKSKIFVFLADRLADFR